MITSVSLNPSVDKSVTIECFHFGSMNRVVDSRKDAGGKAINVAVVAAELGIETRCVGFLRRENGQIIENKLIKHGVACECLWLDGSIRTNLKVLDQSKGVVTEINEPGLPVTAAQLEEVTEVIARAAEDSDYLVLTGSLPPGVKAGYYGEIISMLSGSACRLVLDAEGAAFKLGVSAKPYFIKPNKMELEMELGRKLMNTKEVAHAALKLVEKGIERVGVSLGAEGALLAGSDGVFFTPALKVAALSTVGAGDSMVAGMLSGMLRELGGDEVLRRGAACATASVLKEGTGLADRAKIKELLSQITVERVDV